ncbi:hypothetical protein T459_29731 [Capsicum annuum]|uniref:Uncharacterized protein n=1 Tax=Capsicum annuum TaxID=4072 RepID=A0A2G2Y6B1_CAPAN|nr:hypothetical protein T459_29731 [Capsicum annuum]
MDNNNNTHQSLAEASTAAATVAAIAPSGAYPPQRPYDHVLQQQLKMLWNYERQEIEQDTDLKNHQISLTRIKNIMKADKDVPISRTDTFNFLVDIIPRDEVNNEGVGLGLAPGGVPYYYPLLGQLAPGGVILGRPAVPGTVPGVVPDVDPSMYVPHMSLQVCIEAESRPKIREKGLFDGQRVNIPTPFLGPKELKRLA